jgi:hypothetical protein
MIFVDHDNMIDLNKKYATRDGLKVKLLAIFENNIFGAIETDGEWWEGKWDLDGKNNCSSEFSLVEVIKIKSIWINVYDELGCISIGGAYLTEAEALLHINKLDKDRYIKTVEITSKK